MKKYFIIGIAAILYVAVVLGIWVYWTVDARYDIDAALDYTESFLKELDARAFDFKVLETYAHDATILSDFGGIFVLDENSRIIACHREDFERFLGKLFTEVCIANLPEDSSEFRKSEVFEIVGGGEAVARTLRCCGYNVVLSALMEDVMWSRNRFVPLLATILFVIFAAFVWLILHQMGLSDQLQVYIDVEESRIAQEQSAAAEIQMSALPRKFPAFPMLCEFDIYADMTPAKEVGGDFYDFFRLPDGRIAFLVADVTGKGVPAALFMMNAKTTIKSLMSFGLPLEVVVTRTNAALREGNTKHMLVSAWIGVLDVRTGEVEFVNAGHNPPIRFGGAEVSFCREKHGPMLGAIRRATYTSGRFHLAPNEKILLYTDGVTEAHDTADQLFGEERLLELVRTQNSGSPTEICAAVKRGVDAFVGEREQFDDITVLALEYRGPLAAKSQTFAADQSGVATALDFVEEALASENGGLKTRMLTVSDEIFSNIVKYSGSPNFIVTIDSFNDFVRLTCSDTGRAWNPLTDSAFDPNAPAASRKMGGMGIQIVRRMMDYVLYARRNEQNELMLVKKRG